MFRSAALLHILDWYRSQVVVSFKETAAHKINRIGPSQVQAIYSQLLPPNDALKGQLQWPHEYLSITNITLF